MLYAEEEVLYCIPTLHDSVLENIYYTCFCNKLVSEKTVLTQNIEYLILLTFVWSIYMEPNQNLPLSRSPSL